METLAVVEGVAEVMVVREWESALLSRAAGVELLMVGYLDCGEVHLVAMRLIFADLPSLRWEGHSMLDASKQAMVLVLRRATVAAVVTSTWSSWC